MAGSIERLVYMANQIARNLAALGEERAVAATADHIASFWTPGMKAAVFARLHAPDHGLSPTAERAVKGLRDSGAPAHQTHATEFGTVDEVGGSDAG